MTREILPDPRTGLVCTRCHEARWPFKGRYRVPYVCTRCRDVLAGKPHGRQILSGFQTGEEADVVASFTGFTVERREQEDDWVCVTLSRRSV